MTASRRAVVAYAVALGVTLSAATESAPASCLPQSMRLNQRRSLLQEFIFRVRQQNVGAVQIARANWGSHMIVTEMFSILANEYLGHNVEAIEIPGTVGSYQDLASCTQADCKTYDVNMEMWGSVNKGRNKAYFMDRGGAIFGGSLGYADVTKSGIYMRPSAADREALLTSGRFYSSLESVVLPRLPSTYDMIKHCGLDTQMGERCIDIINSRCVTGAPGSSGRVNASGVMECKPLAKELASYDPGRVEEMIGQGDLPLSIVYMGVGGTARMLGATDETTLFYWWEPSALINNQSIYFRVYFDPAVACPAPGVPIETASRYPRKASCDFEPGQPHKGYSPRLATAGVSDVVHIVNHLDLGARDITDLLMRAHELSDGPMEVGVGSGEAPPPPQWATSPPAAPLLPTLDAHRQAACEWLLEHPDVWRSWLRAADHHGLQDDGTASLPFGLPPDAYLWVGGDAFMVWLALLAILLLLIWLLGPLCMRKRRLPTPGQTWETWAQYPGLLHRVYYFITKCCRHHGKKLAETDLAKQLEKDLTATCQASLSAVDTLAGAPAGATAAGAKSSAWALAPMVPKSLRVLPNRMGRPKPVHDTRELQSEQLACGVQWASRVVHAKEGETLQLAITRSPEHAGKAVTLRVWGEDKSAKSMCAATVNGLGEHVVSMAAGEASVAFSIGIAHVQAGPLELNKGGWQPESSFDLHLDGETAEDSAMLGATTSCLVTIVDIDDWPVPGASGMPPATLFANFTLQVFRDNFSNEIFWVLGVLMRALIGIGNQVISVYFLDDVLQKMDVALGLRLAIIKAGFLFLDHYSSYHYNSNVGLSIYAPMPWVINKWNALPLGVQLDHELIAIYRTLLRRLEDQFPSTGYSTWCSAVTKAIDILFNVASIYVIMALNAIRGNPPVAAAILLPIIAYAFTLALIVCAIGRTVPGNFAEISRAKLEGKRILEEQARPASAPSAHALALACQRACRLNLLFTEMVAISSCGRGKQIGKKAIEQHAANADRGFELYYINNTQTEYVGWVMNLIPILIYASAAFLVEFGIFSSGEVLVLLSAFSRASSSLTALTSMKEDWKVAIDLVAQLSALLCSSSAVIMRKVAHTRRVLELVLEDAPTQRALCASLSLHDVNYTSADIELLGAAAGLLGAAGSIPLAPGVFGFAEDIDVPVRTARMDVIMDLLAGLRVPVLGAVLTPPHVRIGVVSRDPGLIESSSLLENLVFGLDPAVPWAESKPFLHDVAALCAKMKMNPCLFSAAAFHAPMMQAVGSCQSYERNLVALVRALLPMPNVLLIQDAGVHREPMISAVHAVLVRFAQGHDLAGILAETPPSPPAHAPRTVVWSASPATLAMCHVIDLVDLSPQCELRLQGSAEHATELLGMPRAKPESAPTPRTSSTNGAAKTPRAAPPPLPGVVDAAPAPPDDLITEDLDTLSSILRTLPVRKL